VRPVAPRHLLVAALLALVRGAAADTPPRHLDAIVRSAAPPTFPVELATADAAPGSDWRRLEHAVVRAARWLAAFPPDDLRFDAAVVLTMIRRTVDDDDLRRAFAASRAVADRDDDNPQRRFWMPEFRSPPEHTSRWAVPTEAGARVNTNRVVAEALHCAENGWRPETQAYACGPMRDGGGYQTTHALWALDLARRSGCVSEADFRPCARALQDELAAAPVALAPARTLDVDLYAERLVMLVTTGYATATLGERVHVLVGLAGDDGSFGVAGTDEPAYYRYHATALATWALVEWFRRAAVGATP
jgi:hypothetical protein